MGESEGQKARVLQEGVRSGGSIHCLEKRERVDALLLHDREILETPREAKSGP